MSEERIAELGRRSQDIQAMLRKILPERDKPQNNTDGPITERERSELSSLYSEAGVAGNWSGCEHIKNRECKCSCGYHGGIWDSDGETLLLELGLGWGTKQGPGAEMMKVPNEKTCHALGRYIVALQNAHLKYEAALDERDAEIAKLRAILSGAHEGMEG